MSDVVIRVENLSKRYRIGVQETTATSPTDVMMHLVRRPLHNLRRLHRLAQFQSDSDNAEDIIWALKDVTFNVRHGEVVGIIGRNGAGKSTLLKILSRITVPSGGYVATRGRVASLLEVGTGFNPELTGRENAYMNGTILGMRKHEIDRKFDEIVAFSGVARFIDTPIKRYSSGMKVRLAFAVAAHLEPEILIVDEVLAVGDFEFQKKCLGKMGEVARGGRTVLFVSHNMQAVQTLCGRTILLNAGGIECEGDTAEVIRHYLPSPEVEIASQRVWHEDERPGNNSWQLVSVGLKDTSGAYVSSVNISQDVLVEITYDVVENGARVNMALVLFDEDEVCAFSSLNNSEANAFYGKPLRTGRYTTTCCIYGNLLNKGSYTITLNGYGDNWKGHFKVEQALVFHAVDDGMLRGDFFGYLRGATRPRLTWETSMCDAHDDQEPG